MAGHTNVRNINESVQQTQMWLKDLVDTQVFDTEDQAYSALRAVLITLRDRLTPDEAAHLASELPMVVRGVFYENWKPSSTPKTFRDASEFDEHVRELMANGARGDARAAARTVFQLLENKISAGEISHIRQQLPSEIRDEIWPQSGAA